MSNVFIIDDDILLAPTEGYAPDAAKWKRVVNFVIDYACRYGIVIAVSMSVATAAALLSSEREVAYAVEGFWLNYLLGAVTSFFYHAAFETLTDGRTPGKWLTGTRALRLDGRPLDTSDALLRSLWRIVPLEPLTFLADGRAGWHDERTDTRVVDVRAARVSERPLY